MAFVELDNTTNTGIQKYSVFMECVPKKEVLRFHSTPHRLQDVFQVMN